MAGDTGGRGRSTAAGRDSECRSARPARASGRQGDRSSGCSSARIRRYRAPWRNRPDSRAAVSISTSTVGSTGVDDGFRAGQPESAAGDHSWPGVRPTGLGQKRGELGARVGAQRVGAANHPQPPLQVVAAQRPMTVTTGDVTADTFFCVHERDDRPRWLVLVVRVPAEPSRHRVAVWRELRRIGALSLGQGAWVVPDAPVFADGVARVIELATRGEGEVLALDAAGRADADAARVEALFTAERAEEWAEFVADCAKFDAEIDKEIRTRKFTMAELEEEEQSLERLRRWYRDIKARDIFGAPAATEAEARLKHCADRLADYTEQVFTALHQM